MVFEKIKEALITHAGVEADKITMDANFVEDLGIDSLDLVDLVMELEDEFEIEFPEDKIDDFKTVGDVINYIEENK